MKYVFVPNDILAPIQADQLSKTFREAGLEVLVLECPGRFERLGNDWIDVTDIRGERIPESLNKFG